MQNVVETHDTPVRKTDVLSSEPAMRCSRHEDPFHRAAMGSVLP
jgi:hypothetical protein